MEFIAWANILSILSLLMLLLPPITTNDIIFLENNITIQNIALTNTHVYLGAKNSIIKYTNELNHVTTRSTGPKKDNPIYCITAGDGVDCSLNEDAEITNTDNYNRILLITDGLEKSSVLLQCGTLHQGTCNYISLETLQDAPQNKRLSLPDKWVSSNLANASTVSVPSRDGKILFVARSMTYLMGSMVSGQIRSRMRTMMSARNLFNEGTLQDLMILQNKDDKIMASKLDEHVDGGNWNLIDEKDGVKFYHAGYTIHYTSANYWKTGNSHNVYFTTVQKHRKDPAAATTRHMSKLVRLTPDNSNSDSTLQIRIYVENTLQCSHNNIDYNILVSVDYLDVSDSYGSLPDLKKGDRVLFGVFAHEGVTNGYPGSYSKFAVCQFSLNSINEVYDRAIARCKPDAQPSQTTVPKVPWIDSNPCAGFFQEKKATSFSLNETIPGMVLHTEEGPQLQAITAYAHPDGVSLFVSSQDHTVRKFALINDQDNIRLHEYSRKKLNNNNNYNNNELGDSIFVQMKLNSPRSMLYAISTRAVARIPVIDCGSRVSCFDCVVGPSCGWCALENKCTSRDECAGNDKAGYFVETGVDLCPSAMIDDAVISMSDSKDITLITSNVPTGPSYKCRIATHVIQATRADTTFTCDNFDFSRIADFNETAGEGEVSVSVVSEVSGSYVAVVSSSIVIYKCSSYRSCDKCVVGKYPCGWCAKDMLCGDATTHNCKNDWIEYIGYGSNKSSEVCPRLLTTANKYLPNGVPTKVVLHGRRFPEPSLSKKYTCRFSFQRTTVTTPAVRMTSSQISCREQKYSFSDAMGGDQVAGVFTVKYGDALIDSTPQGINAVIYKCESKKFCSSCIGTPVEWGCGWCGAPPRCRFNKSCDTSRLVTRCPKPVIEAFRPLKASIDTRIKVNITGIDLGTAGDLRSVTVAGTPCVQDHAQHVASKKIVCDLDPSNVERSGPIVLMLSMNGDDVIVTSSLHFYFVKPSVESISPTTGPCSGGTLLTLTGNHLDAGNKVKVSVGKSKCEILERRLNTLTCKTTKTECGSKRRRRRREVDVGQGVCVTFDGNNEQCSDDKFTYKEEPIIVLIYTNKKMIEFATFFSGGQEIHVRGQRLSLIQDPKMIFTYHNNNNNNNNNNNEFVSDCRLENEQKMLCLSPNITTSYRLNNRSTSVWLGFIMANLDKLKKFRNITVQPDPVIERFEGGVKTHSFKKRSGFTIRGEGLDVLHQEDVMVDVGGMPCIIEGITSDNILCTLPPSLGTMKKDSYPVTVTVGKGGLVYNSVGVVREKMTNNTWYFILAAAAAVLVIIIIVVLILYKRRHMRDKKDYHKNLQLHMDKIESQYARECKEAFAEYQIETSDLTSEVEQETAPCREFSEFAMRVLYPGLSSHPILEGNRDERKEWERCMVSFIKLLKNKHFLLTFVRTLEGQPSFQMTDRCIVASLLMVSLQDDIVFVTDILKELLTDLINKAGSGKRPKLLLRRTESIAEKLLTNWLAYTLYDFLSDVISDPLFKLYSAVNILLDKEPADAMTFDAKNSLSEDKLLRTKIDFKIISLNVEYVHSKFGAIYEGVPVLSTDTITQCKEKIVKFIYKNQPHSLRPSPDMLQLGHVGASGTIRYMQDCDASNLIEGEWKKLNTLQHMLQLHKIPECAMLRLSMLTEAVSTNGGSNLLDDSLPNITFPSSISSTPMLYDYATLEPKLYHLVKPSDTDFSKDDIRQSKLMAEVYLTRLLKTKETLLDFVNHLFKSIFGMRGVGGERIVPPSIKFLFDFLDGEAEKMCIEDFDVHHTWKNNSLPLRFWINIIKNPDFVFDIGKSSTIDSCLSVIAQLFMDSCSPDEHRLGKDSPSNKLLFAKEIPGYKKEVKRFYKDVKDCRFDEEEFYGKLDDISRLYGTSFNSCNAAFELMSYAITYKVKLMDNLEDNSLLEHAETLQEIMENIPDD